MDVGGCGDGDEFGGYVFVGGGGGGGVVVGVDGLFVLVGCLVDLMGGGE